MGPPAFGAINLEIFRDWLPEYVYLVFVASVEMFLQVFCAGVRCGEKKADCNG
jgi:hypothetical protein